MKPYLFAVALASVISLGCIKENDRYLITNTFPAAGLTYVQLRPNQYFIYKDSATGLEDSVVVTKCITGAVTTSSQYGDYRTDYLQLEMTKFDLINSEIWLIGKARAYTGNSMLFLYEGDGMVTLFSYLPYVKGITLTVEGNVYSDVLEESELYYTHFPDAKHCYWAPGVGLIKISTRKDSVEKTSYLVRHN
jgi:hypothetical protein